MPMLSGDNFKINRAKLSEQIADRLEHSILSEELEDDEKLPPEQTLAEQFNVSKNVVRESLNILKERGLVKSHNGAGNFVTRPKADNLSDVIERMIILDNIDYRQIYDTRIVLETSACREAAARITDKELAKLERLLKKLENKDLPVPERRAEDFNFHIVIAKACGNNLLAVLIQALRNIIEGSMFLKRDIEHWDSVDEAIRFHRRILDALTAHDADEAESAMYEHLYVSKKNVERSMQQENQ